MHKKLTKELSLLDVFCVATGAMLSSGLFILPGLAYAKAGPSVILSYLIAGFLTVPTILSTAELTTAMPKAGGDYFYIMRGFGPLFGTLAGFSSWFSLSLKGAFSLIGMGAYLSIITQLPLNIIAVLCCLLFISLNIWGIKEAVRVQVFLVIGLVAILLVYIAWGILHVEASHYTPFFSDGIASTFSTASFVFISYAGLTKIVALAEEIKDPGRNLPLGMFLSILITTTLYAVVIFVTIGVIDLDLLKHDLTPISDAAGVFGGSVFKLIVSIGAFLAFISTANSGIMTAARYPLGMSRDKLLPTYFQKINSRFNTPHVSILFTGLFIIISLLFLRLEVLVKVASSLLIVLFMFANLTVIIFRKSKITGYRPKFFSPLYPYTQIFGIASGLFLLMEMGMMIVSLCLLFFLAGFLWYKFYAQKHASQDSALLYVLDRLIAEDQELHSDDLLTELKDIVIKRDTIKEDTFHKMIEQARVLDLDHSLDISELYRLIADIIEDELHLGAGGLCEKFMRREKNASSIIRKGLAIPHIMVEGKNVSTIVLVRAKAGIVFPQDEVAHILFVLVGSLDNRTQHLKNLAAIAQIMQNQEFDRLWNEAGSEAELRNVVLLTERKRG